MRCPRGRAAPVTGRLEMALRKRTGGASLKSRAELYKIVQQR
jgi:hypothetical protein